MYVCIANLRYDLNRKEALLEPRPVYQYNGSICIYTHYTRIRIEQRPHLDASIEKHAIYMCVCVVGMPLYSHPPTHPTSEIFRFQDTVGIHVSIPRKATSRKGIAARSLHRVRIRIHTYGPAYMDMSRRRSPYVYVCMYGAQMPVVC